MTHRLLLAFTLLLAACLPKQAPADNAEVTITGRIVDSVTGKPLPLAQVIFESETTSTARRTGRFAFRLPRPSAESLSLTVRFIGFVPVHRSLPQTAASHYDFGTIRLPWAHIQVDDLIVTDTNRRPRRP
jgi:carboxypeptidase family protein